MRINCFDFEQLIFPIPPEDFFNHYWENKPLVLNHRNKQGYEGLLTLQEAEYLLTTLLAPKERYFNKVPWIRLINNKKELNVEDYLRQRGALRTSFFSTEKILNGYRSGNTIVLNGLEYRFEPVRKLCALLEELFGHLVGTNLFLTPSNAQGFQAHYDPYSVFILQLEGEKLWKIYSATIPYPIGFQDKLFSEDPGTPIYEISLKPGDLIYLPRGYVHEALTSNTYSLHLSIGIKLITWLDVLEEIGKSELYLQTALPRQMLFRDTFRASPLKNHLSQALDNPLILKQVFQSLRRRFQEEKIPPFRIGFE